MFPMVPLEQGQRGDSTFTASRTSAAGIAQVPGERPQTSLDNQALMLSMVGGRDSASRGRGHKKA
jgi:hypothetical protein